MRQPLSAPGAIHIPDKVLWYLVTFATAVHTLWMITAHQVPEMARFRRRGSAALSVSDFAVLLQNVGGPQEVVGGSTELLDFCAGVLAFAEQSDKLPAGTTFGRPIAAFHVPVVGPIVSARHSVRHHRVRVSKTQLASVCSDVEGSVDG